jgi:hypothetical protein
MKYKIELKQVVEYSKEVIIEADSELEARRLAHKQAQTDNDLDTYEQVYSYAGHFDNVEEVEQHEVKIGQHYQECSAYIVKVTGLIEDDTVIVQMSSITGMCERELKQSDSIFKPENLVK